MKWRIVLRRRGFSQNQKEQSRVEHPPSIQVRKQQWAIELPSLNTWLDLLTTQDWNSPREGNHEQPRQSHPWVLNSLYHIGRISLQLLVLIMPKSFQPVHNQHHPKIGLPLTSQTPSAGTHQRQWRRLCWGTAALWITCLYSFTYSPANIAISTACRWTWLNIVIWESEENLQTTFIIIIQFH